MTKARDLANIISGGFDATDIPNLDTAKITSGTFADARLPNLNASKITAGTIATARLGSGTANSTTFLRGDNTFASAGGTMTPAFYGKLGTNSSSNSSSSITKVTSMTTSEIDTDSAFDGTTFTVPSGGAGKYFIFGTASMQSSSDNGEATSSYIYVNGSSVAHTYFRNASTRDISADSKSVSIIINLSASDTVELYGRLASDTYIFVANRTFFGGYKIIE